MTKGHAGNKCRHEYKYVCSAAQRAILKIRAQGILERDKHAGMDGCYGVRSLYFDDLEDSCYYENESGIGERDKYRIRIYNRSCNRITLEKKSKVRGMTLKLSSSITVEQCREMMAGKRIPVTEDMNGTLKQILTEMYIKNMHPKVIVEYVRYPFTGKNGNVRITFDEGICSSNDFKGFLEQDISLRPIMECGRGILEVKWDEYFPDFIKSSMQLDSLLWSSFSKYYLCRRYNVYGGIRI